MTISKNTMSKIISKINKTCKFNVEKNNIFELINAKNVSMHKNIQTNERTIINLKFLILFNMEKRD